MKEDPELTARAVELWRKTPPGKSLEDAARGSWFSWKKVHPDEPLPTMTTKPTMLHWAEPRRLRGWELARMQTFPDDFNYRDQTARYVCGMSVPPVMMQRLALEVSKMLGTKEQPAKVTGPWTLKALREGKLGSPRNGMKVFSCFSCGGGSTMGYKLAGFDVVGCCEIDPDMLRIYQANHHPKHAFLMPVQDFKSVPDLPEELFHLDILDGSPPCSAFSMAGNREDDWGKARHFTEGQAKQVLDDLFFHFIDIAARLKPRVVIAENVKGLLLGTARFYVKEIFRHFDEAGYDCQLFLLNSAAMGVPQTRERTFFVARRKDLKLPKLELNFNERPITAAEAIADVTTKGRPITPGTQQWTLWKKAYPGESFAKYHPKGQCFTSSRVDGKKPFPTLTSQVLNHNFHWREARNFSPLEFCRFQSFPDDYDFGKAEAGYVCGMSVPPLMMQRLALEVGKVIRE